MEGLNELAQLPWTWILIRSSGIIAWIALTSVVAFGLLLRTRLLAQAAPPQKLNSLHRWLGAIAVGVLFLHVALLLVDPFITFNLLEILIPFTAQWNPLAVGLGTLSMWAMIGVLVVNRMRSRLGKAGVTLFRNTHRIAYASWPLATAHYALAGSDVLTPWGTGLILVGTGVIVFLLLTRGYVPKPVRGKKATHSPAGG